MDGSATDEQVHRWLQQIADNGWVSLHYENPGLGGVDRSEVVGGGYQRYKMAWSQPMNRAIWSLVDARFTGLLETKISYFGVWSRKVPGPDDFLRAYAELPQPRTVLNGKGFILHAGTLAVSFG
jgi:hypothetical protein